MEEFNNAALKFVLHTSKYHIKNDFDINDKCDKTITLKTDNYDITINRNCFHSDNINYSYFEDYCVSFTGKIKNKRVYSKFYLEWDNNIVDIDNELVPANTRWNPVTGIFSNRNIKIRYEDDINI
jgi:hypothetical protein